MLFLIFKDLQEIEWMTFFAITNENRKHKHETVNKANKSLYARKETLLIITFQCYKDSVTWEVSSKLFPTIFLVYLSFSFYWCVWGGSVCSSLFHYISS